MVGERDQEAAPGQCPPASTKNRKKTASLARLGPKRTSARLYAACATSTHRGEPPASCRRFARHSEGDPVPRAASALSSLPGRERLARNARVSTTGQVTIRLFGSQTALPPCSVRPQLSVIILIVLQHLQDYVSYFALQNYASYSW